MTRPPSAPLSLRDYAKHRGVSAMAVSKAVKGGRLSKSVVRVNGQPKISNPELADQEWDATTDLSKAPGYVRERAAARANGHQEGPPELHDGMSLAEASAAEKYWAAKLKEQQFRERSGELVEVKEVAQKLVDTFTSCRTKLLGVPSRVRQALPELPVTSVAVIEDLIREALEELAQDSAAAEDEAA